MHPNRAFARLSRACVQAAACVVLALAAPLVPAQEGGPRAAIVLGQSVALTGPGAALGVPYHQGARLYFDRLNASGGLQGRRIELVTLDDQGEPARALANTRQLLERGVLALFGYLGAPQVSAAYPLIQERELLLFAPLSAADELRGPQYPLVYALRPGYAEEAAAITRHAETLGARRLGILHAADGESLSALEAAERTMTGLGANLVARAPLPGGLARVMAARPESVLVIAEPAGAAQAIEALRSAGFRGPVYGFSTTGEALLADRLGPAGAGVVVVRVVPRSNDARLPVVRALQAAAGQAGLGRPDVYMLEGYLAAQALAEALRRAPQPSRAQLRKALERLDDVNLGGFRVHFADNRVGSRLVELSLIDSRGRIRE